MAGSDNFDLDFTSLLDPATVVPEPVATPQQEVAMNDEAVIGESNLTSNGFFVRLFPDAPRRAPASAPPTILVVEDDEVTSALLERLLIREGYKVIVAANRAGIVVGMKAKPDLVILDILLPDANGFDILNRIRSSGSLRTLPVLMLSNLGALEDIMNGLKMGANGYLTKPAKSKALLNAIEELLYK
jgi:two-component system OmpR family response regulator